MESYGRQPSSVEDGTLNEWMATAENLSRETKLTLQTCGYLVMQQKNQRDYGKVEYATSIREKKNTVLLNVAVTARKRSHVEKMLEKS